MNGQITRDDQDRKGPGVVFGEPLNHTETRCPKTTPDPLSCVPAAIGWLLILHVLADILIGVGRSMGGDRATVDLFATAVPRAQICLLAIWLAVGRERWSWRLSGLIAGLAAIFSVFVRLPFPRSRHLTATSIWLAEEWAAYFHPAGPGDLWVKAPLLLAGVIGPLVGWRLVRAAYTRSARQRGAPSLARRVGVPRAGGAAWLRPQFRLQDVAVWLIAVCLTLAAVFRWPPYSGWFAEFARRWWQVLHLQNAADVYSLLSAVAYVLPALAVLGAVYARRRVSLWWGVALAAAIVPAAVCDWWRRPSGLSEVGASLIAAATIAGSLLLVKVYPRLGSDVQNSELAGR